LSSFQSIHDHDDTPPKVRCVPRVNLVIEFARPRKGLFCLEAEVRCLELILAIDSGGAVVWSRWIGVKDEEVNVDIPRIGHDICDRSGSAGRYVHLLDRRSELQR
jgi:hypothetical protein